MMLNQTKVNEIMSHVMKDEQKGIINEDTMFMIETVLLNGTMEELSSLTGDYFELVQSYMDDDSYVLVSWNREGEGRTLTKVNVKYLNDWARIEEYPEYKIIKSL
jgi:hypothetical protein